MTWIRNPWWDGFWILSGAPIDLALMLYAPPLVPPVITTIMMVLESAHVVSPMLLAWTRRELRAIVMQEWIRYIVLPMAVMIVVLIAPTSWVAGVYFTWNIYHFGMQNFGVTSLYCRSGNHDDRVRRKLLCLGITAFGMGIVPLLTNDIRVSLFCMGLFSCNHWLTDIGLSSRVARWHWGFIVAVLVIGVAWLLLRNGPLSVRLVPQILTIRAGIGMIHFIYSARIWRLSDPQVRAIIGGDIFLPRHSPFRV
jgi:hypothetical protein